MPTYCPCCGAELEPIPSVSDSEGTPLWELTETGAPVPAAEGRIRRALEYMAEPKHQPRRGTWSRIRFETVREILEGKRVDWRA